MTSSYNEFDFTIEPETPSPDGDIDAGDIDWDTDNDSAASESDDAAFDLGFDFDIADVPDRSGLGALVNSSFVAHQKLPVLDLVLDRAARRMSTSLRQLTDENAEVALDDVTTIRFGDFLHGPESQIVIGVLRVDGLGGYGLLVAETELVLTIVDLLLGGRRGAMGWVEEGRAFTAIELGLAQRLLATMIGEIQTAFKPVVDARFHLERMETNRRFAAIVQEANACVMAKFRVRMGDIRSRASLILPQAILDGVRDILARDFIGEAGVSDGETSGRWRAGLEANLNRGDATVRAVLGERMMTIGDLSRLAVGDSLDFEALPNRLARVSVGDCVLGFGRVGRLGDRLAVRLGGPVSGGSNARDAAVPAPAISNSGHAAAHGPDRREEAVDQ